jgi:hypothetical protein
MAQSGDMEQSEDMEPSGELGPSAVQALLRDGTLAGTWTLDAARSTVAPPNRSTRRTPTRRPSTRRSLTSMARSG